VCVREREAVRPEAGRLTLFVLLDLVEGDGFGIQGSRFWL